MTTVVVVGGGGREHALAKALARGADKVVVTPGNAGIAALSKGANVSCSSAHPEELDADLFVIGPEAPLVEGLADRLRDKGRRVFGPGADGAKLEGSKAWMKHLLEVSGVPTAGYSVLDDPEKAVQWLSDREGPWVIKTDGLAAGKGVLVTNDLKEAAADVRAKLSGTAFGAAGRRVVLEEFLEGSELSVMAVCDGQRAVPLAAAQDFKRIGEGDSGPNTGGMGAYSPVPVAGSEMVGEVMDRAVEPTLAALRKRGVDYRGVLYAGVMATKQGPKILEFNVRFGDPETQVVVPRFKGDLVALLSQAADGRLGGEAGESATDACVGVVLASEGYPAKPRLGDAISGLEKAARKKSVEVFSAGVAAKDDELITSGGRVVCVSGHGADLAEARRVAYDAVASISWRGIQYRRDIAAEAAKAAAN